MAVVAYAYSQFRTRQARIRYNQPVESFPLFVAKVVVVAAVVMAFAYQLATARGLPYVLVILAVLIMVYGVVTKRTVFGRQVYAIGGNLAAATLSGVKVKAVNFWIFVNMGFLAAVAGVVFSSRSNGAQPGAGNSFELDAIAAAFIGGAAVTGGVGTVVGAMVGGLLVGVMSNGMQLMGIDQSDPVHGQGPRAAARGRLRRLQQAPGGLQPLTRRGPGRSRRCPPTRPDPPRPARW